MPLVINCWPEDEGDGQINVNIEYTLQRPIELHSVAIVIPLGSSQTPHIVSIDGAHKHDATDETLTWLLDFVDGSNRTGTLEFNIASDDAAAFFPINVSFASKNLYYDVHVASVLSTDADKPVGYSINKALVVDTFRIS